MPYAIQTFRLTKTYPPKRSWTRLGQVVQPPLTAVQDVSLRVPQGEIFGLLGPNGAGKTTLIKMLTTLIEPTAGEACIQGLPLRYGRQVRARLGLVTTGERSFYWRLSGLQNLVFFAALQGAPPERPLALLEQVGLGHAAHQRVAEYSTGMRKRLTIARALLHDPPLLFLDEPTSGLDPQGALALQTLIRNLSAQGKTIVLSTHVLSEAEKLCQRVALLRRGRLLACGTLPELRAALPWESRFHIEVTTLPERTRSTLQARLGTLQPAPGAPPETTFSLSHVEDLPFVLRNIPPEHLRAVVPERPSLEDVFLHVMADQHPAAIQPQALPAPCAQTAPPPAPRTRAAWLAFLRRDWQIERSYRLAFLLQLGRMAFSVGVFYFLGELVNELQLPSLQAYGGDYFAFVLIGLAMRGYFGTALTGFTSSIRSEQTLGTLEAVLTTPVRLESVILGSVLWRYLLTTFHLLLYLGAGMALGRVHLGQVNLPAALLVLALSILVYGSFGVLSASFIMVFKRGDPVAWFFQAVSDFLGGMYYPAEVLSPGLQNMAALLPVTYSLRAMRMAVLQGAPLGALRTDVLALGVFAVLLLPVSLYAFRAALQRARRDGTLVGY